uniref:NADH-ubiquinone oxidoreductase chain 4L n=1 Tax=Hymenocera picta TaxID=343320 RepID=A0A346RC93_9EUCA|nr:NADH dehydrogenase subunit 4L [Hymenocera picta]AXS63690.1 NADH dehydrogenase subunit 4L [Hymenocera picta]
MSIYFIGSFFCFFCGVVSLVLSRKHILNSLLSLEFIMLNLYFCWLVLFNFSDVLFVLYFLAVAACEGALGLSILVSMVRSYGNDNFSSSSMLSC